MLALLRDCFKPNVGRLANRGDVGRLIRALGYKKDMHVQLAAVRALGRVGDAKAVEPLIAIMKGGDWDEGVFGEVKGPRTLENFIASRERLRSTATIWRGRLREAAAIALGEIGDARAVPSLIAALEWGNHGGSEAAEALGEIGRPAMEPLMTALRHKGEQGWFHAMALGCTCETIVREELKKVDVWDQNHRAITAHVVEALIMVLQHPAPDPTKEKAAFALGTFGDARAVGPLIAVLKHGDRGIRWRSVEALGMIGQAEAVDPLITALMDGDSLVRITAAEALGKIGDPKAIGPIQRMSARYNGGGYSSVNVALATLEEIERGHSQ